MAAPQHEDAKEATVVEIAMADEVVLVNAAAEAEDIVADTVNSKYTEDDYNRVLKKIDRILLPIMWLCYGTQQADKTAVSTQATFGMRSDTKLVGQQFSWLTTAFYLAYLVGEAPGNYLMQRFGVNKILFICMFCWGVVVLCIAFAQNFSHLVALRSLQGLFECTISPAFLIITASFYVSREHTMRSMIWATSNSGMGIITQLVMYGIGSAARKSSFGAWRWISVFLGSWTIVLSFFALLFVGTAKEVKWLSKEEKRIIATRVAANQTGSDRLDTHVWRWDQVRDAFQDPQTYFFFFSVVVASLPNGGLTSYINLLYVSFGFSNLETILKGIIPVDLLTIALLLVVGGFTLKRPQTRFFFMMALAVPAFVGFLTLGLLPKEGMLWTRWGLYLMATTGRLPGFLIWTLLPSNVAGRTKKSVTGIIIFIAYCIGSAIGAQIFRAEWAPRYAPAIIICGVMYAVECVLFMLWRLYYTTQNKRRAKRIAEMGMTSEQSEYQGKVNGESDMTDWQNIHFKYNL